MRDDYTKKITRMLDDYGIDTYRFGHTRRHRCVEVAHGGRTVRYVFPLSGSDWRGPMQAVSGLRRMLNLQPRKAA